MYKKRSVDEVRQEVKKPDTGQEKGNGVGIGVIELAVTTKDIDRARRLRNVLLDSDIRAYRGVARKLGRELFMVGLVLAVGIDLPGAEDLDGVYLVGPTMRRNLGRGSGIITGWKDALAVENGLQRRLAAGLAGKGISECNGIFWRRTGTMCRS